jgi:hypothetical protein
MNPCAHADGARPTRHAGRVSSSTDAEHSSRVYEILVRGELSDALAATLGAKSFEPQRGKTVIVVEILDQAHLHGILESLRDQAIDIERVNPV